MANSDDSPDKKGRSDETLRDRPVFRVLDEGKIDRIHEATVEILETVGIKMDRPEAIEMMADAGCAVDGEFVRIPRGILEDAIASAPKEITIYNREGEEALNLGGPEVYTNTGYTDLDFFDVDTGERRDYALDDFRLISRVADALPNVDIVGTPGVVRPTPENPLEVINHLEVEAMMTHTSKPLHLLVADGEILKDCFEMAEAIVQANGAGSLSEKPFVLPMLNPISPLIYNEETVDKLLLSVDWGVPVICGPMPLAGGTSPVTLAGTIALANAESLAGLVISQVRQRGSPYVMITFASGLDMATGNVSGGPEGELLIIGGLQMGHHYGIPIAGGWIGGGGRGNLDGGTGWQQMLGGLSAILLGGNAGLDVGPGQSLEACVMADELVRMLRKLVKGMPTNKDTLAVDVIRDVGAGGAAGGTFLGHPHTFEHFRDLYRPELFPGMRYEDWVADGRKSTEDLVRARLRRIMETHEPKPIPGAAREKIAAIIERARARVPAPV